MAQIAAIGEVMVELAPHSTEETIGREILSLGFAGDTFNTSVYLSRTGTTTDYVTLLGDDPYSRQILDLAEREKIGTHMTTTMAGRLPGMYLIRNSEDGEREFYYWRKEARARELFTDKALTKQLVRQLMDSEYIYFSGITLAIISDKSRDAMMRFIKDYRQNGGTVCFDINYRPRLWDAQVIAQQEIKKVMPHVDIALLTLDDEEMLWGNGEVDAAIERYKNDYIGELILKRGADEVICVVEDEKIHVPVPKVEGVVDTTGAGDSFNAGYLSARIQGKSPEEAAKHGIHVASIVIRNRGAIVRDQNFFDLYRGLTP